MPPAHAPAGQPREAPQRGATGRSAVGLLGPYGYGNLGDASIQEAMIANLRRRLPEATLYGVSLNPTDTAARHRIPSLALYPPFREVAAGPAPCPAPAAEHPPASGGIRAWLKASPLYPLLRTLGRVRTPFCILARETRFSLEVWRCLKGFRCLVISGGGQIDDDWGGPWRQPFSLLRWTVLARAAGTPVVLVSVGAGPLARPLSRRFTRWMLRLTAYRSYRDGYSRTFVEQLGGPRHDPVFPDLAFSLDVPPPTPRHRAPMPDPPAATIGIGPLPFYDPRSWPHTDAEVYRDYVRRLAEVTAQLAGEGHGILLFPSDVFMDDLVITDILRVVRARGIAPPVYPVRRGCVRTVPGLLGILRRCDLVVASRFHGTLLAYHLGIPVIGLSPHPKVATLMADAGQETFCLPIASAAPDQIMDGIRRITAEREGVTRTIRQFAGGNRDALRDQYDRLFGPVRA